MTLATRFLLPTLLIAGTALSAAGSGSSSSNSMGIPAKGFARGICPVGGSTSEGLATTRVVVP